MASSRSRQVIDLSEEDESFLEELDRLEQRHSQPKAGPSNLNQPARRALQPSPGASMAPARRSSKRGRAAEVVDLTCDSSLEILTDSPAPKRGRKAAAKAQKQSETELDLEDDCSCAVCLDYFLGPQMLPCGHAFCESCLSRCFAKEPGVCPTCRTKTGQQPWRLLIMEPIVEKVVDQSLKKLAASGRQIEADHARAERDQKLRALEIARMAEAAPAPRPVSGRRRR